MLRIQYLYLLHLPKFYWVIGCISVAFHAVVMDTGLNLGS